MCALGQGGEPHKKSDDEDYRDDVAKTRTDAVENLNNYLAVEWLCRAEEWKLESKGH
jgi:hypothetical protein